jgi:hypothetical protein
MIRLSGGIAYDVYAGYFPGNNNEACFKFMALLPLPLGKISFSGAFTKFPIA